jgi:hypothetical protein
MDRHRLQGMICGYYLSKFDPQSYEKLGFPTQLATHRAIGATLGVPPQSIQNWRDEFDPIHPNSRKGWHKRPMVASRLSLVRALGSLSEEELYGFVNDILVDPTSSSSDEIVELLSIADADETADVAEARQFVPRGLTGHRAEEEFLKFYEQTGFPIRGDLDDCRHLGCGFDFRIRAGVRTVSIEVKGLSAEWGGLLFTQKEWDVAKELGADYYLAVVRNLDEEHEVLLFQDPASKFAPKKQVYTVVQVRWTIAESNLRSGYEVQGP